MSPAAAVKRKPESDAVPMPEVHEALARRHAADIDRQNRMLRAYREAVALAADDKPIPSTVADAAVEAAHVLGLKPSRMQLDIVAMRRVNAVARAEADHRQKTPERQDRLKEIKEELRVAERVIRDLQAEASRLTAVSHGLVPLLQEQAELRRDYPHLFEDAAAITEQAWRHLQHG